MVQTDERFRVGEDYSLVAIQLLTDGEVLRDLRYHGAEEGQSDLLLLDFGRPRENLSIV